MSNLNVLGLNSGAGERDRQCSKFFRQGNDLLVDINSLLVHARGKAESGRLENRGIVLTNRSLNTSGKLHFVLK